MVFLVSFLLAVLIVIAFVLVFVLLSVLIVLIVFTVLGSPCLLVVRVVLVLNCVLVVLLLSSLSVMLFCCSCSCAVTPRVGNALPLREGLGKRPTHSVGKERSPVLAQSRFTIQSPQWMILREFVLALPSEKS